MLMCGSEIQLVSMKNTVPRDPQNRKDPLRPLGYDFLSKLGHFWSGGGTTLPYRVMNTTELGIINNRIQ